MNQIHVHFAEHTGNMKPMHAVNSGPVYKYYPDQRITNLEAYREAGIPFARMHDSPEVITYGGPHAVDITGVFPDFDKDPYDPASYDFLITDEYMKVTQSAGAEIFYGLAQTIEHWPKKYGTLPPKDFHKWAVICEHIIRHYNEGWADGYHMGVRYWEIWNEADLDPDDAENKRCWGGTKKLFFEFYNIAAAHLKKCFPDLMIGGPALATDLEWAAEFLDQVSTVPDFFSWHRYANEPKQIFERANKVRAMLDERGFYQTESNLNEWNYVKGWTNEDWLYTIRADKSIKAAAFVAAVMCGCQYEPVDMLMYYNAAPHIMNGMFNTDIVSDCLKGYYSIKMFNELYRLNTAARVSTDSGTLYPCAAVGDDRAAVMFSYFSDDDDAKPTDVCVNMDGFCAEDGVKAQYYLLDKDHDMQLVREETFCGNTFKSILNMSPLSVYLITLEKL